MSDTPQRSKRRTFLAGRVTGAGAAAAVAAVASAPPAAAKKPPATAKASPSDPVLFKRTEEAERYNRTLDT